MFQPTAGVGLGDIEAMLASIRSQLKDIASKQEADEEYLGLLEKRAEWLEAKLWEITKGTGR